MGGLPVITHARLKQLLRYDYVTGVFTWNVSSRGHKKIGRKAGWKDNQGYLHIRLDGVLYPAHRLAWLYVTGEWPKGGFVDHINTNPSDNKWDNLRDATKRVNQENRRRPGRNNKSGFLGVSPNGQRWSASIVSHRMKKHLGTFDTPEQAHEAYVVAKRELHKGCTL